jgi:hypothetical protein
MATALNQTTLSGAITPQQNVFTVASATNITAPVANINQQIYVIGPGQAKGELMDVVAVSGNSITVSRLDEFKAYWPSGSLVLIGPAPVSGAGFGGMVLGGGFQTYDPPGGSASQNSNSAAAVLYTPWVNVTTGAQWLWSTVVNAWVAGWQNDLVPAVPTAAVASAAGYVTPSGPLFHITGTSAITGFTLPVGFTGGSFTVIPDGNFTTTNANNIALASTAVTSKPLTFIFDPATAKFYPSY